MGSFRVILPFLAREALSAYIGRHAAHGRRRANPCPTAAQFAYACGAHPTAERGWLRRVVAPIAAASNKWTVTYQFVIEFRQVRGDAAPGVLLRRGCDARAYVLPDEARLPGMVNYP